WPSPLPRKDPDCRAVRLSRDWTNLILGAKKPGRVARLFCLPLCYGLVTSLRISLPPSSRPSLQGPSLLPSLPPSWPEPSWPPSLLLSSLPKDYLSSLIFYCRHPFLPLRIFSQLLCRWRLDCSS